MRQKIHSSLPDKIVSTIIMVSVGSDFFYRRICTSTRNYRANPPSEPAPASLGGSWTLFKWGLASKVDLLLKPTSLLVC